MENTKHARIAKGIEVAANIGLVIVALLAVGFFVKGQFARSPEPHQVIPIGSKVEIQNVDWRKSRETVVLALSTTCHFCTESAPFYRELTKYAKDKHIRTIAVFPQSFQDAAAYLKNENVEVDEIRQSPLSAIQVSGTPTLLLIDLKGTVQGAWLGKLAAQSEKDVLAKLGS
jgi:hypothetical protein